MMGNTFGNRFWRPFRAHECLDVCSGGCTTGYVLWSLRDRAVVLGLVVILLAGFLILESRAENPNKPNVLFIAVDDLNDWVGCLGGHPQTQTPNIDRLAARGILFTNAHCQGTMCNPSRISLLWGRRPSLTGFYDNHYPVSKEPEFLESHVSLPAHFASSGYKTLTAGKVFHGGAALSEHFQVVGPRPGEMRFSTVSHFPVNVSQPSSAYV